MWGAKYITIETFNTDGAALAADLGGLAAFCFICSYLVKDSDFKKWILEKRKISLTEMFQVLWGFMQILKCENYCIQASSFPVPSHILAASFVLYRAPGSQVEFGREEGATQEF